jgi:hypothetical protein
MGCAGQLKWLGPVAGGTRANVWTNTDIRTKLYPGQIGHWDKTA